MATGSSQYHPIQMHVDLTKDLKTRVERAARKQHVSQSLIVRQLIEAHLDRYGRER